MITAQQARSRATAERILEAAEALLSRRAFDDLSVTEIAHEAQVSVGGFYARFEGKEALLEALHERYESRRTRRIERVLAQERWVGRAPAERVRGVISEIVALMSDERHVLRTFLLRYWAHPEDATPAFAERLEDLYDQARRVFLLDREGLKAEDPDEAARAALGIVMGACRDILVMKPESVPGHPRLSRERLIDYLTSASLAVLDAGPTGETP